MNKKILLMGNVSKDWLLADLYPIEGEKKTILQSLPGGTFLLKKFLASLMPNTETIVINEDDIEKIESDEIPQYAVRITNVEPKNICSAHITQSFGCLSKSINRSHNNNFPSNDFLSHVNLLAIDDSNLDIEFENYEWINELNTRKKDFSIIYKLVHSPNNKLFEKIADQSGDNMIVIVNADDLRAHGCRISRQLSWDKTIEDFIAAFKLNPNLKALRHCSAIIIRFNLEATLCVYRAESKEQDNNFNFRLFYLPAFYEGQIKKEMGCNMQGITSVFIAALA